MEINTAIMMADLSGYTALTEIHGAVSAADLIDRYLVIAKKCLVGDCQLHQQTGDELMFVSGSADTMLATAKNLAARTAREQYFLQVHGGLHVGKLLKRNGHYFGTAINIAARIASRAVSGSFYCSASFANAVTDRSAGGFQSKGRHSFKNIVHEQEIFELGLQTIGPHYIDPVCRMLICNPESAVRYREDPKLFFCSTECRGIYVANKDR